VPSVLPKDESGGLTRRSVESMDATGRQGAMKTAVGMVLGIFFGILMGLFGVLNSVFSDGSPDESLVLFIGVILVIYTIFGALWGFLLPEQGWKWGLVLAGPGAAVVLLMLVMYLMATTAGGAGGPVLFGSLLVYVVLLLATACLGAWAGSARARQQGASTQSSLPVRLVGLFFLVVVAGFIVWVGGEVVGLWP
jgi:hypothetical protein